MVRQARKHDRSGSQPKVDAGAGLPPKKPRGSDRPLGSTPRAPNPAPASASEPPPRRDEVIRPARNSSAASGDPSLRGSRGRVPGGSDLESDDSDGPGCSTADSTIAILQQDDCAIGKYFSSVVVPKSEDSATKMAAADVEDLPVEDSRDNEGVTMDSEAPCEPVPSIPLVQDEEAVQLAKTLVNERVKEFMEGISEPAVLQSHLSKITSLLVQATSIAAILHDEIPVQKSTQTAALVTRVSELEQQVEELSKKLCSTEDKLEVTKVILKETQADMLEAQSDRATAITAMNSLAMRVGASFARLGTILDPPPNAVDSLEESIKQMTALVSLIGPVSYSHGSSLARSSLTFGVAALLCRERGIEGMREPSAMDTHQFVRSQGPEFQSLISQVVDSMEQQLAETLQGGGWRDSGATKEPGEPTDSKKGKNA